MCNQHIPMTEIVTSIGRKHVHQTAQFGKLETIAIVYKIPNRRDSSILHKACTYDAIRHHNINEHNAELRGTAPGANILKSMFM